MRILVTNDDGVLAPGIAALAVAAHRTRHEVLVVAPLEDWSGASSAVGAFYRRDGVDYRTFALDGLADVPTYGVDAPPALGVILACVGGFGPRPDIVLSGINHGVNVGRSALHSGTIGAALTAAQFGIRGLAISIRYGPDPVPWNTAAVLAESLVGLLETAPPATVLNLNVPDVELNELKGIRAARLGRGGTIRSVSHDERDGLPPGPNGTMRLDLAIPGSAGHEAPADHDPTDVDALLIGRNYATITALVGVHEATGSESLVKGAEGVLRGVIPAPRT